MSGGEAGFGVDVANTINDTINRHRDTHTWTAEDRQLAMTLLYAVDARGEDLNQLLQCCRHIDDDPDPAKRSKSVNAIIGRGVRSGALDRSNDPPSNRQAGQLRLQRPGADESIGDGPIVRRNADQQFESGDRADDSFDRVGTPIQLRHEFVCRSQVLRDRAGIELGRLFTGQNRLPTLHGLRTRYGIRALLTSRGWLQGRANLRQAGPSARPVGGTNTPGGVS